MDTSEINNRESFPALVKQLLITKRSALFIVLFSLLFSIALFLPKYLDGTWTFVHVVGFVLALLIPVCVACTFLLALLEIFVQKLSKGKRTRISLVVVFWTALVLILAVWSIQYYIYYPGCFSPDSYDVIRMVSGEPFESLSFRYVSINNHHPILYSLFVSLFVHLGLLIGNIEIGLAILTFFQMIILATTCAYAAMKMFSHTKSIAFLVVCVLFFILNPLMARYSFTVWKDVVFAAVMLLYMINIFDIVKEQGKSLHTKRGVTVFTVLSLLIIFLRSNGIFVVIAVLVSLFTLFSHGRKSILFSGAMSIVVMLMIQIPVFGALGVQQGHFSESISIPLQQVARTVAEDGQISQQQEEFLSLILPIERYGELYREDTPNTLKFAQEFNDGYLESHKLDFMTVWLQLAINNPNIYFRAWAAETEGYWSIFMNSWLVADSGYFPDSSNGADNGQISGVFAGDYLCQKARSVLYPLFNIGCMIWFLMFTALTQICFSRYRSFAVLVPLLAFWTTFLIAAPIACEFRYMFPLHIALPLVAMVLLWPIESGKKEKYAVNERAR